MPLAKVVRCWDGVLYSANNFLAFIKFILFDFWKYRDVLQRNKELKDKHKGQRCFLLLNGPSLNSYDLSKLTGEIKFAGNFFYRSPLANDLDVNYYCVLDSGFFVDEKNVYKVLETCPKAKCIFNMKARKFNADKNRIYYSYNKYMPNVFGVSTRLGGMSSGFVNLAFYMIGIAIYMGFSEINILGLDFEPGFSKHFYDKETSPDLPQRSVEKGPDYIYGYWYYAKAHDESFAVAKYARKRNVAIYNLNPQSYIRAFPFREYETVFAQKKSE